MKKVLSVIACGAVLGMTSSAFANSITFTDTTIFTSTGTNAAEDYVSHGGGDVNVIGDAAVDWVTWNHQFSFDPAAASIVSASLSITFADDVDKEWQFFRGFVIDTDDSVKEFAVGWTEGWEWDIGEVDTGTETWSVSVSSVADGVLQVNIAGSCVTGDFELIQSDLTVAYNPVPEPATMLLFGAGLSGLAVAGRRRK